jgi:hypothetical protein
VPPTIFELDPAGQKDSGDKALYDWLQNVLSNNGKSASPLSTSIVSSTVVDFNDEDNSEETERKIKKQTVTVKNEERKLLNEFRRFLERKGRKIQKLCYSSLGMNPQFCDAYEPAKKHLIEAKASVDRESIRMAIGQLYDYNWLGHKGKAQLAILLPSCPEKSLEHLLKKLHIALIWKKGKVFEDNCGGKFV